MINERELTYIRINKNDEEKVKEFMEKDNIQYDINDRPLAFFLEEEAAHRVMLWEEINNITLDSDIKEKACNELYLIFDDNTESIISGDYLEDMTNDLMDDIGVK